MGEATRIAAGPGLSRCLRSNGISGTTKPDLGSWGRFARLDAPVLTNLKQGDDNMIQYVGRTMKVVVVVVAVAVVVVVLLPVVIITMVRTM